MLLGILINEHQNKRLNDIGNKKIDDKEPFVSKVSFNSLKMTFENTVYEKKKNKHSVRKNNFIFD